MITLPDFDRALVVQALERECKATRDAILLCERYGSGYAAETVQALEKRLDDVNTLRLMFQMATKVSASLTAKREAA